MQPSPRQGPSRRDHLPATGPAVEDHGRVVTASPRAAAWYRRAQRAADPDRAAAALRLAVGADPGFTLAAADLKALTGTPGQQPAGRAMNWERHHIEVVATAAAGPTAQAADLLREHLAMWDATLSPSASPPGSSRPQARATTSRTWPASFPAATPPHGRAPRNALVGPRGR